jgi:hypothetical protein
MQPSSRGAQIFECRRVNQMQASSNNKIRNACEKPVDPVDTRWTAVENASVLVLEDGRPVLKGRDFSRAVSSQKCDAGFSN